MPNGWNVTANAGCVYNRDMTKTTRRPAARPSRATGTASRSVSARKRPTPRRSAAATTTTSTTASARSATRAGSRRCEAPNCSQSFRPKSDRQIYCSPACKVRAFYWAYKEQSGERYAARYERQRRRAAKASTSSRAAAAPARGTRRPAARKRTTRT